MASEQTPLSKIPYYDNVMTLSIHRFNVNYSPTIRRILSGIREYLQLNKNKLVHLVYTSKSPCYTRAFGDGPRNFEPWSSDVDDT
ncbi:hypothetical protein TNCV_1302681 [Trichonephila clavipes]|nr:hypothetical protein TNCV_1302681 [Trichonephila clavipes]